MRDLARYIAKVQGIVHELGGDSAYPNTPAEDVGTKLVVELVGLNLGRVEAVSGVLVPLARGFRDKSSRACEEY